MASSIFEERMQNHLKNSDFVVLYRTNSQSRAIEEALRRGNIKYKIVGGLSFYQRKEIKDLLAYMRVTVNPNDEASLKRVINLPKRGIGDSSINKLIVAANELEKPIWDILQEAHKYVTGRAANAVLDFVNLIKTFMIEVEQKDAFESASYIAKGSGLVRELYADKTIEGLSRYENVQELLNAVKEFVESDDDEMLPEQQPSDKALGSFLQEITLLTGVDNDDDDDGDKVTLMTVHMAKGLEFKNVYIVGMEEDLFPSQMMLSSRADLEEERRLFYVAITRAKEKLFLTFALSRYRFGRLKTCEPSRFIEEIDQKFIKLSSKFGGSFKKQPTASSQYAKNLVSSVSKTSFKQKPIQKSSYVAPADFAPSDTSELVEGMKVEHAKFGFGEVVALEQNGANRKAKVNFADFGEKTLLLSFAKLKIH